MQKNFNLRFAANGLYTILSLIVIFHLLVVLRVIPYTIVWGGRLEDRSQMLIFELVSILLNLVMLTVVLIKIDYLKWNVNRAIITAALWMMAGLFLINTIGSLFVNDEFEKLVFTPLTLILAIFSLRMAISKE